MQCYMVLLADLIRVGLDQVKAVEYKKKVKGGMNLSKHSDFGTSSIRITVNI